MTKQEITTAGELAFSDKYLSDDELKLAIKGLEQTVSFIRGGGREWTLARIPLLRKLNELEGYRDMRAFHAN